MKTLIATLDKQVEKIDQAFHLGRLCPVCQKIMVDDIFVHEGDPFHYSCFEAACEPDDYEPDWDLMIKDEEIWK